jgi:anti-sigma B factor antagonist
MNITTREEGGVAIVGFEGNLDTNTAPDAQEALSGILDDGADKILVDFGELDYISSAGLRVLLATAKRMTTAGGAFHICSLNETVNEVFEISGFSMIFKVFVDESEALAAF